MLNKISKKSLAAAGAFLALGLLTATPASAQGFAGLFNNTWSTQLFSFADFMSAVAYLIGIGFGIKGGLKLKEWNDSKGRDATLSQALIPFAIAGIMLGLPSILSAAKETTAGTGTSGTSITSGGAIRAIN